MKENNNFKDLEIFLAGTFHQDIEDPVEALKEYIDELDIESLNFILKEIEVFFASELSENEKEEFITNCTFIYYPALGVKPMEWLVSVLEEMRNAVQ